MDVLLYSSKQCIDIPARMRVDEAIKVINKYLKMLYAGEIYNEHYDHTLLLIQEGWALIDLRINSLISFGGGAINNDLKTFLDYLQNVVSPEMVESLQRYAESSRYHEMVERFMDVVREFDRITQDVYTKASILLTPWTEGAAKLARQICTLFNDFLANFRHNVDHLEINYRGLYTSNYDLIEYNKLQATIEKCQDSVYDILRKGNQNVKEMEDARPDRINAMQDGKPGENPVENANAEDKDGDIEAGGQPKEAPKPTEEEEAAAANPEGAVVAPAEDIKDVKSQLTDAKIHALLSWDNK